MHSLHRFLVDYDTAMLRTLAGQRGVELDTNRQREAADRLAAALAEPVSVRAAVERLSAEARRALDRLLAAGGRMREAHLSREFGEIRPVGPGRLEREEPWRSPANAVEELYYLGLIFRGFVAQDEAAPGQYFMVPDEVSSALPAPAAALPAFSVEVVPDPAQAVAERTLVWDMLAYVVYIQNHEVRLYADGRLARRDSQALLRELGQPAERRLAWVRHLAERCRLVAGPDSDRGGAVRLEPAALKAWLTATPERQLATLYEAWRDDRGWIDLCHVPGLECDAATDWPAQYDAVAARQAVLRLLARCPAQGWWRCASFVAEVKRVEPDFQRPDGDYGRWYIRDAAGEYLAGFESWEQVEGALLADLIGGPLRWLGLIARADTAGGPLYRLTAAGARLLGLEGGEPQSSPAPPIVIHPDLRIELPPPVSLYVRFQLERFAELERAEPCRYRLSVRALARAQERGLKVESILAFLQQASGQPVPDGVAGQLKLWAGRLGQVRLEEVAVLEVKSERVLQELLGLPQTRPLIDRVLSPTVALVRKQHLPRLEKELSELGYLSPGQETAE